MMGSVNALSLFGATVFVGLGNGLTMPSASAGALSVRPDLAGSTSGLTGALTVGGRVTNFNRRYRSKRRGRGLSAPWPDVVLLAGGAGSRTWRAAIKAA